MTTRDDLIDLRTCADMLQNVAARMHLVAGDGLAGVLTRNGAVAVLEDLDLALGVLRTAQDAAAAVARAHGASWAQIGSALGTSRQAAHQRFSSTDDD